MEVDDMIRNIPAVDFKRLASKIWQWSVSAGKDEKKAMRAKGKMNDEGWAAYLMRLHYAIRDGVWASDEDLARQMDLNMDDHGVYIDMDQYFKSKYNSK